MKPKTQLPKPMNDFQAVLLIKRKDEKEEHGQKGRIRQLPPISELRDRYNYNPETGIVTGKRGEPLIAKTPTGYLTVRTNGPDGPVAILQHRLAWAFMKGEWPNVIDHLNGIRNDNRWSNLRNGTARDNTVRTASLVRQSNDSSFVSTVAGKSYRSSLLCKTFHRRNAMERAYRTGEPLPPPEPKKSKKGGKVVKRTLAAIRWTGPKAMKERRERLEAAASTQDMKQAELPLDFPVRRKNND